MVNTKVKGYRVMLGLTQEQLGERLGCSIQSVSSKEKGKTPFNDKEKIVILNLVKTIQPNITIDELFFLNINYRKLQKIDKEVRV